MGSAYIEYSYSSDTKYKIDLGIIQAITDSPSKKSSATPIPTRTMQDAFPLETGNSLSYTISFVRKHSGTTTYDRTAGTTTAITKRWSNKKWYEEVTAMIDRWQVRTNGCKLHYTPGPDEPYIPEFEVGGYIKSINRVYDNQFNERIVGSLVFTVGTMYVNSAVNNGVSLDAMDVIMSDSSRTNWYVLYAGQMHSCIEEMHVIGGPDTPFEYLTISIPRKKLQQFAPELVDNIVAGKNRLRADLLGSHSMTVTKVKNKENVEITAYCDAWVFQSNALSSNLSGSAWNIIQQILGGEYGVTFDDIIYLFNKNYDNSTLYFPKGDNVWRVLQICAIMMGCKIYFANNRAYVIDFRIGEYTNDVKMNGINGNPPILDAGDLRIYDPADPFLGKRCIGKPEIDNEGIDPVVNSVTLLCSNEYTKNNTNMEVPYDDEGSITTFDPKNKGKINMPELAEVIPAEGDTTTVAVHQATSFARNYIEYLREPQRSISFMVKEGCHINGEMQTMWASVFGEAARADSITDLYSEEYIDNMSAIDGMERTKIPQKLILSKYERIYPKCVCEYTFGVISDVSLSDFVNQVNNSIY